MWDSYNENKQTDRDSQSIMLFFPITVNYNRSFWSSVALNEYPGIQIFMVNRTSKVCGRI